MLTIILEGVDSENPVRTIKAPEINMELWGGFVRFAQRSSSILQHKS